MCSDWHSSPYSSSRTPNHFSILILSISCFQISHVLLCVVPVPGLWYSPYLSLVSRMAGLSKAAWHSTVCLCTYICHPWVLYSQTPLGTAEFCGPSIFLSWDTPIVFHNILLISLITSLGYFSFWYIAILTTKSQSSWIFISTPRRLVTDTTTLHLPISHFSARVPLQPCLRGRQPVYTSKKASFNCLF